MNRSREPIMKNEREQELLQRANGGDRNALGELMEIYRPKIQRVIEFRIDSGLRGRVDASDVLQETFVEAVRRFDYFLQNKKTSLFLWLRFLALQKLDELYRHHFGAQKRDANREVSIFRQPNKNETTAQIAAQLLGDLTSPSRALLRDEARDMIESALTSLDELDQEVLALRHFEQLSNHEVAEALGIQSAAASKRFVRALQRLKAIIDEYGEEIALP